MNNSSSFTHPQQKGEIWKNCTDRYEAFEIQQAREIS